ncbi:MAG TPA: AMP-binding protein [Ktedonobacteraceae bacterium]|jgi:non-ribosomal peptide synthetase component F|nr:AMP-binding protein [Ktedonobacteraceae bacterium]
MHQNVLHALRLTPLGVHHLVAQQAVYTPGMPAVVCGEQRLTYAQLERQANLLAWALQRRGVGAGTCVAVYLAPSVDILIALLAILKVGGCYVPLETVAPVSHVLAQLEHCGASLLLTQQKFGKRLSTYRGDVLSLDQDQFLWMGESSSFPAAPYEDEQITCMLYRSTLSGALLGVQISQYSLLTGCLALFAHLNPEPGWQFALFSLQADDLGYSMLFLSLLTGGCLHLLPDKPLHADYLLASSLRRQPFDVLTCTPSHLLTQLNSAASGSFLPRKHLLLSGELFDRSLLDRLCALAPACQIYQHYGSMECSPAILLARVATGCPLPPGCLLTGSSIYVLDAWGQQVPSEVVGELYIGGAGLAYGYVGLPSETAQRFVPDPFSGQVGSRLYRTGNRVRWLPDGNLEVFQSLT